MDQMSEGQFNFAEGTDVYGSDGDKVGEIVAVQPSYVVVEKGFFFPTDYYIPTSAVATYDDDKVYLNVTKDEALNQGWDAAPSDEGDYATTGGYSADMGATSVAATDVARSDAGYATDTTATTTRMADDDTLRVQVHEEELTATKRAREIGQVGITKDVVEEERTLEVPVTEERVRVERRVVDRPVDASDAAAFEGGTIDVPLRGEEVQLQKQTRVAEEIEVGKEQVQRTETVGGTVRREEVRVDETGDTTAGTARTTASGAYDTSVDAAGTTGAATGGGIGDAGDALDRAGDALREAGRDVRDTATGDDTSRSDRP